MLGLRQKLSLGFGGLLLILLIIGIHSVVLLSELGDAIDVILRENYRSVIACQQMKEAIERMDSGIQLYLLGYVEKGTQKIKENETRFGDALQVELHNITLPGEGERASILKDLFSQYKTVLSNFMTSNLSDSERRSEYFTNLLPLFESVKTTADEILHINQQNMSDADARARRKAHSAIRQMYIFLVLGFVLAGGFIFFTRRWILQPINRLIRSARDIASGNLDLVVKIDSQDEIGRLSEAFNTMAESLRRVRRTRESKLAQMQHTVQQAFKVLPDPVVVVDLHGKIEVVTSTAHEIFGLKLGGSIVDSAPKWLLNAFYEALKHEHTAEPQGTHSAVQVFVNAEERFFLPKAFPIQNRKGDPTAVMLIIQEITRQRREEDLKRGVISTVSHQLKTPLTSIRMAIHLLLDEDLGKLTSDQYDVLVGAEEESERLHKILEDLLDIGRIEAGGHQMDFQSVSSHILCLEGLEPFQSMARDKGLNLVSKLPDDLPEVWADLTLIHHVFGNLLGNAINYTNPGGVIMVSAQADEEYVKFSVTDTGSGIPAEYHERIFEQFFRIPDQGYKNGAGLGLAIAKEIVESHGGTISVQSNPGKGSTFTFSLKRTQNESEEESAS